MTDATQAADEQYRPQQVTRIPPWRPGTWVKIRRFATDHPHSGRVRRVASLAASITSPQQSAATWRVFFGDGLGVETHLVERLATEAEIARAQREVR